MRRHARGLAALALAASALLLGGCWSRREPENLATVWAAALDRLPDGRVRWRVELPLGAQLGAGAARQGGGGGGPARILAEGSGADIPEAEQEMARRLGRELFWGHADFFLIGEEAARQDMGALLDFIARRYRVRRNSLLFVVRGQAGELLARADPGPDRVLGNFLRNRVRGARPEALYAMDANTFLRLLDEPGVDPFLPALELSLAQERPEVRPAGVALFRGRYLAGFMPEEAALGLFWLRGQVPSSDLVVACPGASDPAQVMAARLLRALSRVQVRLEGLQPRARVSLWGSGELVGWNCAQPLDPLAVEEAERVLERRVLEQVAQALGFVARLQVDPAGLGAHVHRRDPRSWARVAGRWEELLPRMEVQAEARLVLRGPGLTSGGP